jgi:hypothetical protein
MREIVTKDRAQERLLRLGITRREADRLDVDFTQRGDAGGGGFHDPEDITRPPIRLPESLTLPEESVTNP